MVELSWNYFAVFVCIILIIWKFFFNESNGIETEIYYQKNSRVIQQIVDGCTILNNNYIPTYLWGKNGHIQSLLFSIFGRFGNKPKGRSSRKLLAAKDGSTVSYDLFKSTESMHGKELVICVPGICNHSETDYIRAFCYLMNQNDYDVAVLNHTGALKDVQLTKPRIFTYGHTQDLDTVVQSLYAQYKKKLIIIGFSLGGNITMKYLGESEERQSYFHFAACICQGYDLTACCSLMQEWDNMRWVYNYSITRNMLKVINQHKQSFDSHCKKKEPPVKLDWHRIQSAKTLLELDIEFSMKVYEEDGELLRWYENNSSSQYMEKIKIPILVLNSKDDPLIPECLFKYPKKLIEKNPYALFIVPPYGGHLGFFEGGYIIPNALSWLDRLIIQYCDVTSNVMREEQIQT